MRLAMAGGTPSSDRPAAEALNAASVRSAMGTNRYTQTHMLCSAK